MTQFTIARTLNPNPRQAPDREAQKQLGFGRYFTNHMFLMNYDAGEGWHSPRIEPYGPLSLDPSSMIFHYGQAVFEGMKAYRQPDGSVSFFRPMENFKRLNHSSERMGIPPLDPALAYEGLRQLVELDQDWVPSEPGTTLYIRPFIIATEVGLGVRPAKNYQFAIILTPSGNFYKEGSAPVRIYVEDAYVRAVKGGTGQAKTPGNYAASILAQEIANEKGYSQVLWLDGIKHENVEEVGSMNVFFVLGDEVHTPELSGSILPGITRRSVIELLRSEGITVVERPIPVHEVIRAMEAGDATEAFGSGTAAVITPMASLCYEGRDYSFGNGQMGPLSQKVRQRLTGIQFGTEPDPFGWNTPLQP